MRRILSLALASALVLCMAACGNSGSSSGSSGSAEFSVDLETFYSDNATEDFPAVESPADDMLESLYPGISDIERVQTVIKVPMMTSVAFEAAMVEVADAGDVAAMQDIFQARIDAQVDGGAFYPETIEQWQNASQIVTRGNYVCLFVVPEEYGDLAGAFNAL